ncbi:Hypothetical_protein [Hexamita inflata]|uniref:Hypothetical_protein n=1 Tax=Hexamita inflata TaxID=28002 RepID=A0ABP1JT46_9EUKA
MLLNLLYNGNLCKLDQETRNFQKVFEKMSVTEMENQIQHKKYSKLNQICSHLQYTLAIFENCSGVCIRTRVGGSIVLHYLEYRPPPLFTYRPPGLFQKIGRANLVTESKSG